ncbi:hypothetical protein B0H10DRAFT_2165435 [Mycena sp. CBHHK59/15]|nr:hypothetical protein B0H10DRAFT_2165435 [Mycena sp. CBHHK59/15]
MVPIITSWNAQKDRINDIGSKRFALDTGQELVHFYSVDNLVPHADSNNWVDPKLCGKEKLPLHSSLNVAEASALWDVSPCTSEHVAGKLSLCLGMPVMIKHNDATELCITKGQEALVVGWQALTGPDGQCILDTLFVKLIEPPKTVMIPGLAENIVALSRAEQVLVLPNFAMTDYSSQGKTCKYNVVDLHNCKTHFSNCMCLSRSSIMEGTIIVQGWDSSLIT